MYGSPDDLNVVEEKAGIIGMSSKTNAAEAADATKSTKADEVKEKAGDDTGTTSGIESFMPRKVVLKDAAKKLPTVQTVVGMLPQTTVMLGLHLRIC